MDFKEGIKHLSEHYTSKDSKNCKVCEELLNIISEFEFELLKEWDYDD